ncbi:hypothetical protein AB6A23_24755 [Paenibacillus tarimensis]
MKKSILVVLVSLIIVAGFVVVNLFSKPELKGDQPPIPNITTDGKEIPIVLGSYTWKADVDVHVDYDEIIKNHKPVVVTPNSEISIDFGSYKPIPNSMNYGKINKREDGWLSFTVSYSIKNNVIKIRENAGKGITIIHLSASWDSGARANYYIPVEVK